MNWIFVEFVSFAVGWEATGYWHGAGVWLSALAYTFFLLDQGGLVAITDHSSSGYGILLSSNFAGCPFKHGFCQPSVMDEAIKVCSGWPRGMLRREFWLQVELLQQRMVGNNKG